MSMSLNDTPRANRVHIGFFGRRNAGKSSLVNAVTGQDLAVVSDTPGTTTDPVYKSMELLPLGPVVIIDTPGFDDTGELGELRVKKTRQVLNKCDIAILVYDAASGVTAADRQLLELIRDRGLPHLIIANKSDRGAAAGDSATAGPDAATASSASAAAPTDNEALCVSALSGQGIHELKERIGALAGTDRHERHLVGDLLSPGDLCVLVVPIDSAAPKGRLILPQQQAIRDILDADATALVLKEDQLASTLDILGRQPTMVITDSQVFGRVARDTPVDVPLTSFSILMARYKGFLDAAVQGVRAVDRLRDKDRVLIAEGCTHHRQCDDIGTVKIPRWLHERTGRDLQLEWVSGTEFPEDLTDYALIIHCGGCMLNEREMRHRMACAADSGVPFTNYGTLIAHLHGILERSLELFPHLRAERSA
ncbi:iron-only hydrogenase maturation protein HydF [Coriobacterium glomerans PW2]|uniref:Iron-only hydrogenase maturation protein HydF n=1 Tax=Coriobacterium glomerans (strain ATCC 49209 / DSM 20642 / JCM 10262 / PW2) TaxID=700015 RepID=F2N7U4_CORGP|nr:[FeFe] hydrogenase H-cluster maturation GTPase HydF [Coriobacterium glomerans]AEB07053.1 iron-only hydrogenase maturation protein HydF [Coriobacterium glomerans PW2]